MLRSLAVVAKKLPKKAYAVPPPLIARFVTRLTRSRRRLPSTPSSRAPASPLASTTTSKSVAPVSPVSLVPVHVPHDPNGVLDQASGPWSDKLRQLLSVPAIVVARQIEMMNVFLGWEEANKYALLAPDGLTLGYLLEEETGVVGTMSRQLLKTHRPFRATVISPEGEVLLRIHRPFALINSRIFVSTPSGSSSSAGEAKEEMKLLEAKSPEQSSTALTTTQQKRDLAVIPQDDGQIIGEVQQEWHLYRRRYNLFVKRGGEGDFDQFARFDGGLLAWDFEAKDEEGRIVGTVNRNFSGFARELFTDTGHYCLSFEAAAADLAALPASSSPSLPSPSSPSSASSNSLIPSSSSTSASTSYSIFSDDHSPASLPIDHRATLLASAVTIDIDYFSRNRGGLLGGGMGGFMPIPIPMGGMGGGGAAGEAGEAGTIGTGNAHEGPLPPTEYEEDGMGGLRNREAGVPRGEDGVVAGGGAGQGWGEGGQEEVMQDPWANEEGMEEGGTWGWGDLFDNDGDGGGGGDGW